MSEISFPILPHLKKFILKFHKVKEPVKVELTNSIGLTFRGILTDKRKFNVRDVERYTDRIHMELCSYLSRFELKHSTLVQFNIEYDRIFKESLYNWVISQEQIGINNSQAIKNFLDYYSIKETEYSWDTAFRAWTRYKSQEYSRKKSDKLDV